MKWDRWLFVAFIVEIGICLAISRCEHPKPRSAGPLRCVCEAAP